MAPPTCPIDDRPEVQHAGDAESLEVCAVYLVAKHIKFLTMGANPLEIDGAYQSNFLFLAKGG